MSSNNKYLVGIQQNDSKVINEIYQQFFPAIRNFVERNSGKTEDAQDVFQDALISIFRRLKANNLEIQHTFNTYFFTVCKNLWYKKTKKADFNVTSIEVVSLSDKEDGLITEAITQTDKYTLFTKKLAQLGKDCQRVLNLHFAKKSFKEIAATMDYASEEYARRRKYLCKNKLIKLVKADIRYKELAV